MAEATSTLLIKIKALVEGVKGLQDLTQGVIDSAAAVIGLSKAADTSKTAIDKIDATASGAASGLNKVTDSATDAAGALNTAATSAEDVTKPLEDIGKSADEASNQMTDLATAAGGVQDDLQGAGQAVLPLGDALDGLADSAKGVIPPLDEVGKQSKKTKEEIDKTGQGTKQTGTLLEQFRAVVAALSERLKSAVGFFTTFRKAMSEQAGPANVLLDAFTKLVKPLLVLAGIKITFDFLKNAADYAARTETLGITLGVVARQAGYLDSAIGKYEASLKKLGISTQAARDSMIQMMQAGISLGVQSGETTSNVERLARAAQDLAVVSGQNSSETFQRLITNIQQLDSMGLRYMGLMVNIEDAQAKFATKLNTTAGALTEVQKRQAVLNEVLAQSTKFSGAYEESLESVGKKVQSLSRYQQELSNAIGNLLLPAYGKLVDGTTQFLKDIEAMISGNDKLKASMKELGNGVGVLSTGAFKVLTLAVQILMDVMTALAPVISGVASVIGNILSVFASLAESVLGVSSAMSILQAVGTLLGLMLAGIADAITLVEIPLQGFIGAVALAAQGIYTLAAAAARLIPGQAAMVAGLEDSAARAEAVANKATNRIREIGTAMTEGDSATMRFAQTMGLFTKSAEELGQIRSFKALDTDIRSLIAAQRDNTMTAVEVDKAYQNLSVALVQASKEGALNEKQFKQLQATLEGVKTKGLDAVAESWKNLKLDPKALTSGISVELGLVIAKLKELAQNAFTTAEEFNLAFSEKLSMAKTVQELAGFQQAAKVAFDSGKISAEEYRAKLAEIELMLPRILDAQLGGATTIEQINGVTKALEGMGEQGILSGSALVGSLVEADVAAAKLKQQLADPAIDAAMKVLGLTASDLGSKLSEAGAKGAKAFQDLAASAKLSSSQLATAFASAVNLETSINGLARFKAAAETAFKAGQLSAKDYETSLTNLGLKFDELFEKNLKSARTKADFEELTNQVKELGAKGTITGEQMQVALDRIGQAATGTREKMERLAAQTTAVAEGATKIAQADLQVQQQAVSVMNAKKALLEAENKLKKENTELARAEVAEARANLQVEEAKAQLSQASKQQEMAQQDLLLAQQKLINAEKEKERNAGSAAAAAAVVAAEKEVSAKTVSLETTKQATESQRQNVVQTESAALQAKTLADNLREAAAKAAEAAANAKEIDRTVKNTAGQLVEVAVHTKESVQQSLEGLGLATEKAKQMAEELLNGQKYAGSIGVEGVAAFMKINNVIAQQKELMKANQEEAKRITDDFAKIRERIEDANLGIDNMNVLTNRLGQGSDDVVAAYQQIAREAARAAQAAEDSTRSFLSSVQSIHLELLDAQGKEEEVLAARFDARKRELTIQYELLKVQLQIARAQAAAAGIGTDSIDAAIADAAAGYQKALGDLKELERIQSENLKKQKAEKEAAAKEEAAKAKEQARTEELEKQKGRAEAQNDPTAAQNQGTLALTAAMANQGLTGSASAFNGGANPVQLIAQDSGGAGVGGSEGSGISKKIQLDLTAGTKKVTATFPASQENDFLSMIETARGSSV